MIQHFSRAINKIDKNVIESTLGMGIDIQNLKAGVTSVTYEKNGVEKKIRYQDIENLSEGEQASLGRMLSVERYNLRQERALEILQQKGKISAQFKRSLEQDNIQLLQSIQEFEEKFKGSDKEAIKEEFAKTDTIAGEAWFEEADDFFQGADGSLNLFDFYRPGQAGGFKELNIFTWNIFKVEKGLV